MRRLSAYTASLARFGMGREATLSWYDLPFTARRLTSAAVPAPLPGMNFSRTQVLSVASG